MLIEEKKPNLAVEFLTGLRNAWPAQGTTDQELNPSLLADPLFVNMVNASPSGIVIFSYETVTYEYFSPTMLNMVGYSADQLQGVSGAEFAIK